MKKFTSVGLAISLLLFFAGCNKEKLEVNLQFKKATYDLTVDDVIDLINEVKVENSEFQPEFSSSDAAVVEVTPEGKATALKPGEAVVKASLEGKEAVATIKVKAVAASKINLTFPKTLEAGETWGTVLASVTPENYPLDSLSWNFTPTSDQLGFEYEKVSAAEYKVRFTAFKSGGSVLIKVSDRNSSVSSTASIAVTGEGGEAVGAKRITLEHPSSVTEGEDNWGIVHVLVQPEEYDPANLVWEFTPAPEDLEFKTEKVSDSEYKVNFAKYVEGGKLTVKVTDRISESFQIAEIKVDKMPETGVSEISVSPTSLELFVGMDPGMLTVRCTPENYDPSLLVWTSSDENVAEVSEGKVTAVAEGTAVITVKDKISGKKAEANVTVKTPVTDAVIKKIVLNKVDLDLRVGEETFQLVAECYDEKGEVVKNYAGLEWTADKMENELGIEIDVVEVTSNGLVTPVHAGSTVITVFDKKNPAVKAVCHVSIGAAEVKVTEIYLNPLSKSIDKGDSFQIIAEALPKNAENKELTYSSTSPTVATVDAEGNVTGVSYGETTIVVTAASGVTAKCSVKVVKVDVASVTLNIAEDVFDMVMEESREVSATINPSNAAVKTVSWSSSDNKVASVLPDGNDAVIKALGEGTAVIKAEADGKSASVTVKVKKAVEVDPTLAVESIEFNPASRTMTKGTNLKLNYVVTPEAAGITTAVWSSSNNSIASVTQDGYVTANAVGKAKITLIVNESKTAVCDIEVKGVEPESLSLGKESIILAVGETFNAYDVRIYPENCDYKQVKYSSSDPSVASVNETTGELQALKVGTAQITVVSTRNTGLKDVLDVEVKNQDFELSIDVDGSGSQLGVDYNYVKSYGLPQLDKVQLKATYTNGYQPAQTKWVSSDPSVATVDDNGLVTATWNTMMGMGERKSVRIRLSTGNKFNEISLFVVKARPQSVEITATPANNTMYVGDYFKFDARTMPELARVEDDVFTWMCSTYGEINFDTGGFQPKTAGVKSIEVRAKEYKPIFSNGSYTECREETSDISGTISINILPRPFTATISQSSLELVKGKTANLNVIFDPENDEYCDYRINWSSDDTSIATVSASGVVTGQKAGNTTIRATLSDGTVLTTAVTVSEPDAQGPKVGDYYYSDGTYSTSLDNGKDLIGIIFSVDNPAQKGDNALSADHSECVHGFVMSIDEYQERFWQKNTIQKLSEWAQSNNYPVLTDDQSMCGYGNTKTIKAYTDQETYKSAIANFEKESADFEQKRQDYLDNLTDNFPNSADYPSFVKIDLLSDLPTSAPDKTTGWYVPSKAELKVIYENKALIDQKINAVNKTAIGTSTLWSSTEVVNINSSAFNYQMSNGSSFSNSKSALYKVRFVLAF